MAFAFVVLFLLLSTICPAQQNWPLWKSYTARFLDGSGRIIDRSAGDRSTSEGQAYAMFFALVANDRKSFDSILNWTENNLAGGDLTAHLPAWKWGKNSANEWKPLDANSAADADLWLAYDCLEAGRLWRDTRLRKLGETVAGQVRHAEVADVANLGTVLLPGPQGFKLQDGSYLLNPSYTPPQLLARFHLSDRSGPWNALENGWPLLLERGSMNGFAPDWVRASGSLAPAPGPPGDGEKKQAVQPAGSYDAIRIYLWLGMADRATPGVVHGMRSVHGMVDYLSANPLPPLIVQADGHVADPSGTVGFSAAVYPYLVSLGRRVEAKVQMTRLQASLVPGTGLYGRGAEYYDQNLALFATGWSEQRFRFDRNGQLKVRWR